MHLFPTSARPRLAPLAALLALATLAVAATPARAALIFEISNSSATAGGTGSFDVVLRDTGGTYMVSGFSLQLSLAASSGVQFTGATTATTAASYIFGTYQSGPAPFASNPSNPSMAAVFPLNNFVASDSDFASPYSVTLNTNDRFGLAHVTYSVARGTPIGAVTVAFNPNGTSLADVNGNAIAFSAPNATINVVPEPASILSLAAGLAGVALVRPIRRAALPRSR